MFTPRLSVSATWIDNIDLAPPSSDEQHEYLGRIDPGFRLDQKGVRAESFVDYTMQNLFFSEDSDRNSTYHQLEAETELVAVQELLFLEAAVSYAQQLIDPTRPTNSQNIFDVGNLTDAAVLRVTPALRRTFGRTRVEASYTRGMVDYRDTDALGNEIEDTENEAAAFFLGSAEEEDRLTWGLSYDHERARYDVAQDFTFDTATAELGFGLRPQLRLIARGGQESDLLENLDDGGLDETFWEAGLRWSTLALGDLQVLYGERFFGDSYRASWDRDGRLLDLKLGYVEEPTTAAQQLALRPVTGAPVAGAEPIAGELGRLTTEVYLRKDLDARVALVGSRTEIALYGYRYRRDYIASGLSEVERGSGLSFARQLGSRLRAMIDLGYGEAELREGGTNDDRRATLALSRLLSATGRLTFSYDYLERSGEQEFSANWVTLRLDKEF